MLGVKDKRALPSTLSLGIPVLLLSPGKEEKGVFIQRSNLRHL